MPSYNPKRRIGRSKDGRHFILPDGTTATPAEVREFLLAKKHQAEEDAKPKKPKKILPTRPINLDLTD